MVVDLTMKNSFHFRKTLREKGFTIFVADTKKNELIDADYLLFEFYAPLRFEQNNIHIHYHCVYNGHQPPAEVEKLRQELEGSEAVLAFSYSYEK